jgi:hypothetical protein
MHLSEKAKEEVILFHEQICQWFKGNGNGTAAAAAELLRHFSTRFLMISPNGIERSYEDTLAWLPTAFGAKPDMQITITGMQAHESDKHVLVTYLETQVFNGEQQTRNSSAVFIREDVHAYWLHLWETWA